MKYSLKCGHRQHTVKFPHHIQIIYKLISLRGHRFPLQCTPLQSLCCMSTVSTKATCTIRTEDFESRAGYSPIVSDLQTGSQDEVVEVSIRTAKKNIDGQKRQRLRGRRWPIGTIHGLTRPSMIKDLMLK